MTQVFDDRGNHVPVTVIEAGPCVVVGHRNQARDGYEAGWQDVPVKQTPRYVDDVSAFVENLASRAPVALQSAKQSIRRGVDLPIDEALAHEQQAFDQTMVTKHAADSMRAYLEAGVLLGDMDYDFSGD